MRFTSFTVFFQKPVLEIDMSLSELITPKILQFELYILHERLGLKDSISKIKSSFTLGTMRQCPFTRL